MYCTFDNLKAAISESTLLQLCDDDNVGAFIVDPPNTAYNALLSAIRKADSEIDSHLAGRYDVPVDLVPVPPLINSVSIDLAICNLYGRRRELDVPEGIDQRRKAATKILQEIRAGRMDIPELSADSPAVVLCSKNASDRVFTDDVLNKY